MQPARQAPSLFWPCPAAALLAAVILAGCGAESPSRQVAVYAPSITNADVAESALQRLKAPPGFRLGICTYLPKRAYTRCYRRATFAPLSPARFAALITDSGLTPGSGAVSCPRILRARTDTPVTREHCQARASATSVEFAAFATSIRLHRDAIKPSDRKIAATLRGTVFELTVVATHAPRG
jgi:hypothetical protein